MTNPDNDADIMQRAKTHLGNQWPHHALALLPCCDAPASEITKHGLFDTLKGRDDYLDWVADYKALIRDLEVRIRDLKAQRRTGDVWARSEAQSRASQHAVTVTALIQMRRLGKIWSAAEARKVLAAA